jgi:6-phosphogluconolactonase
MKENNMSNRFIASGYSDPMRSPDIKLFRISDEGKIETESSFSSGENPTFLCEKNGYIYVAEENDSYSNLIKASVKENQIEILKKYVFRSKGLCHISVVEEGILCSFYISGDLILIDDDLSREIWRIDFNFNEKSKSHIHWTYRNPSNDNIYVADLGAKSVYVMSALHIANSKAPEYEVVYQSDKYGPRQVIGMPQDSQVHIINEIGSTIASASFLTGDMVKLSDIRTTKTTKHKFENFPSVAVAMEDKYLLIANRGANSISVFQISNFNLRLINEFNVGGDWPRHISLSADNKYLIVCNQKSNEIVVFKDVLSNPQITDRLKLFGAACAIEIK